MAGHLEDAAHYPGGHAEAIAAPRDEAGVAAVLRAARAVLPIGAQSSLTGGATPRGEVLLATAHLAAIRHAGGAHVCVQPGVTLAALDAALSPLGAFYPPAPTFAGACLGGTIATNAAGAATFKHGATRQWIDGLTVVLASGDVLDLERGEVRAHPEGYFELELARGLVRVPVPGYTMPTVQKLSAGYFAAPEMDLIDLFIGSEGTLGVVVEATVRVARGRPAWALAFVPFAARQPALACVDRLRAAARATWASRDPRGLDVSAIEQMDRRALSLLREDNADRKFGVTIPEAADTAILVTLDLPPGTQPEQAFDELGQAGAPDAPDTPLARFARLLAESGALEEVAIAVPGDRARAAQLVALREAVPDAVNRRVGMAKRTVDGRIEKVAGDPVVPFEHVESFLAFCEAEFRRRGLDAAIWGHVSDGNLHPNVLPRSRHDVEEGKAAILAIGREAIRLGGAPLAEHGVGRNPVKQQLLVDLYGDAGIEEMRLVKRTLDPEGKLAPGVLFTDS
jgi:D-lactate dehydrogenase (cytochrome)